jgi:hypothetical protein
VLQLFDFSEKPLAFRDFAEKPVVDVEALRLGKAVFQANPGFFGRIKSLQHFLPASFRDEFCARLTDPVFSVFHPPNA